MMDQRGWDGGWERDREVPEHDIADALDRPSFALVWLLPALMLWLVAIAVVAMLLF